nr:SUMF1/EgtB/PvdO family nonheme iron enzyme [Planctomycetota bacterium]
MLQRLRLLAVLLSLAVWLPAATADEGTSDEAPPKDAPAKEEPAAPDAPKPDEPKGDEPAKDDPAPSTTDKPAGAPPAPTPGGMTYVEGGRVMIGSEPEYLAGLLAGRPAEHKRYFLYETPYHAEFIRPYFIGKYEVTNAQYYRFLQDAKAEYDTASGSLANLDEIAAHLVKMSKDYQKDPKQVVWLQLYRANQDAIWKAFGERAANFQVKRPDGTLDEYATARKLRFEPLPRTVKLQFYSMQPPANWPDTSPPKGEENHPVRYVSYNDAEKFAEWAGMHLPSEAEWEWAARGPKGYVFPWGNDWPQNALYANWGGKIVDERYEPTTLPVDTRDGKNPKGDKGRTVPIDGDGRSWVGCYHMTGNVAEWTGSWFEPYRKNSKRHNFMGRWVKVIRGGSASDGEMLVLRPACRNFVGAGPDAPPYPDNDFPWVGFRLASYMKSGRDQLYPIVRRATRPKKLKEEQLDLGHFIGAVTRNWVEPGATPVNHVYVLGRSYSIVLVPQTSFLYEQGLELMRRSWKRPTSFKSERGLRKKSETEYPFWTLGIFHTDVPLENVNVRKPAEPVEPGTKGKKKKKGRRGRGRAK